MAIKFQDKTAADKKEIGFHYQHYFALLQLLKLDPEESLSIEEKDDVVIFTLTHMKLVQLKHTLQTKKGGSKINLSSKDYSLWHTIDNWIKLIQDKADERDTSEKQIEFINGTSFSLITNKSDGKNNVFLNNLNKYSSGEIKIEEFKTKIRELINDKSSPTDEETVSNKYIDVFLNFEHIEIFLKKIEINLNIDDLIEKIKENIKTNLGVKNYEDAYYEIEGRVRTLNYLAVKNNQKITYSKKDFSRKVLTPVLDKIRNTKFHVIKEKYVPFVKLEEQNFAKQLLDISVSVEDVIELSYSMQICLVNLKRWEERDSLIFPEDREAFFKSAFRYWKNVHGKNHRQISGEINNSLDCFSDCMTQNLYLCTVRMDEEISNGAFIHLSDIIEIGWIKDWLQKYGKK